MENLDVAKVKKIIWKRSQSQLDESDERDDSRKCPNEGEKRRRCGSLPLSMFVKTSNQAQSFAMPLLTIPNVEEWSASTSIVFTGTALQARTGPPVGAVDIGVSRSAYYFCVALPGVKKDSGSFSCEIRRDGKVCIQGVTSTGEKTVTKYSRVFEMKFQQQCPPGPFSLFFSLPGPVDPRVFAPSFRSDGIFEGVVAKYA